MKAFIFAIENDDEALFNSTASMHAKEWIRKTAYGIYTTLPARWRIGSSVNYTIDSVGYYIIIERTDKQSSIYLSKDSLEKLGRPIMDSFLLPLSRQGGIWKFALATS